MHLEYIKNYFRLFNRIFGKQKWQLFIITGLGFVNGLLDSVGIGSLIPLFAIVAKDNSAQASRVTDVIRDFFSYFGLSMTLYSLLFFMACIFVAKAISEFVLSYIRISLTTKYESEMRADLYRKTLIARWPYLMQQKIGHLENVLMTDVHGTRGLFNRLCTIAPSISSFIVYLAVAIKISFFITAITLGVGVVILIISKPVSRRLKYYTTLVTGMNKTIAHHVNENVQGMKMLKALAIEESIAENEISVFSKMRQLMVKGTVIKQLGTGFIEPMMFIFISLVFAFSYSQPGFSIGGFVVVMYLIQRIFNSVNRFQGAFLAIVESLPFVYHVIELEQAVIKNQEKDTGSIPFSIKNSLEFRNVTFGYREDTHILHDISFMIKKNEMVGIIGPSGSGKTTVADLMLRFFDPMSGSILIDGKPIASMRLHELRKNIGYVSQDIFLKNDTIENNIRFYADNISETEITKAAKMANIYDFIQTLPNGFKTIIGDRGILLSGGQRQRIVLARTLARKPKVLILDEATSALDNESEALIRESIESLKGGVTAIVIAHRLSTVMNCDRLIALDNGSIVEEGPPAELLKDKESYFYKVHHLQVQI